jgi:hypothetical protein
MSEARRKEQECLEALLGDAGPEQARAIESRLATDVEAARHYAEWHGFLEDIAGGVQAGRELAGRVRRGVMAQVHEEILARPQVVVVQSRPAAALMAPWRRWANGWGVLATGAVAACAVFAFLVIDGYQAARSGKVMAMVGQAWAESPNGSRKALAVGQRLAFPARLVVGRQASASIDLPNDSKVTAQDGSWLEIETSRSVRQRMGRVGYLASHSSGGLAAFTVNVPQGRIVDIGTQFEVTVGKNDYTLVTVQQGSVRVEPTGGDSTTAKAGQRAILTATTALTEAVPSSAARTALPAPAASSGQPKSESVRLTLDLHKETMTPDDALLMFVRPQEASVRTGDLPSEWRAALPTYGPETAMGALIAGAGRRPVLLAMDQAINGKTRIYVDRNGNNALLDDARFVEGEDFVPGRYFNAGLVDDGNMALWLELPAKVNVANERIEVTRDRLLAQNRLKMTAEVRLPTSSGASMPGANGASAGQAWRYVILDADSDGDFSDPDGALGVWQESPAKGQPFVTVALMPLEGSTPFAGYDWRLERDLAGRLQLVGQLQPPAGRAFLNLGDRLPALTFRAMDGKPVELKAPAKGYLLIHSWSSWSTPCQRDLPTAFKSLDERYRAAGLKIVGIACDYRPSDAQAFVDRHGIACPQIYNGASLGRAGLPAAKLGFDDVMQSLLVDDEGRVIGKNMSADEIWSFCSRRLGRAGDGR